MNSNYRLLAYSAAGSTLLLLSMFFVRLPANMSYPGLELLLGDLTLSNNEVSSYFRAMQILFVLDGLFLAAQTITWAGFCQLIQPRNPLFSQLALLFGLLGVIMDLSENSIIWAGILNLQTGHLLVNGWGIAWKTLQHLSYIFAMIAAAIAGISLWSHKPWERVIGLTGILFSSFAIAGLYLPEISFLADLWYPVWFTSLALLFWNSQEESH